MFGSSSRVTVSYGISTFILASSALVATYSTSFSTHVGLKGLLLFYRVWIFINVFASIDLFSCCCKLVLLTAYFSSVVVDSIDSIIQQWRCQLFWQSCRRLCYLSFSASIAFYWHRMCSLGVDCVLLLSIYISQRQIGTIVVKCSLIIKCTSIMTCRLQMSLSQRGWRHLTF